MSIQFPPEFQPILRDPSIKASWVSGGPHDNPLLCQNCNGRGFLVLMYAIGGPFAYPPVKGVAHFADDWWWSVVTKTAECPVCHNQVRKPIDISADAKRQVNQLANRMRPNFKATLPQPQDEPYYRRNA